MGKFDEEKQKVEWAHTFLIKYKFFYHVLHPVIIWCMVYYVIVSSHSTSTMTSIVFPLFFAMIGFLIRQSITDGEQRYQAILNSEKKNLKEKKDAIQREKNEREAEKKRQEHHKEMTAKGYVLYNGNYFTKTQKIIEEKIDAIVEDAQKKDCYKGFPLLCKNCDYIWTVKKEIGVPAKCPRCNSEMLAIYRAKIPEMKIYSKY